VKQIFSTEVIQARVSDLGAAIRNDAGTADVVLIGVLKGALVFLSDLLRAIPGTVSYEFIDVVRDVADTQTAEAMEIDFLTHFDIKGKNVYLLKDVVSTGVIETYLLTQLRQRGPAQLKLVALLDRPDLRTVSLDVDFHAFVAGPGTFVGYGLEHQGQNANLPYIATL
jgi:hypoxanthine phosphoribosyltransferase